MELITSFDQSALEALYSVREFSTVNLFIWITELGSTVVIGGLSIIVALGLLLRGRVASLAGLIISVVGSAGAVYFLKEFFERARPAETFQAYLETGFSFPSGHTTMAFAFYGFLAWLLWDAIPSKQWRWASLISATTLIVGIGFSRLYLGVHFASDVLAGFVIAGFFVLAAIAVVKRLKKSGD